MTAEGAAPAVGIFWGIAEGGQPPVLLADLVPLERGEPYGEFLTHSGHYEHWESLAAAGAGDLRRRGLPTAPAWSEYEEWPRGRVVHHVPTGHCIVYADRQLRRAPPFLAPVVQRFGLSEGRYGVRGDPHHVSTRRLAATGSP